MRAIKTTAFLCGFITLAGCATIVEGSDQAISVDTPNVAGAQCTLAQPDMKYYVTTPGTVTVKKSKHNITVTCKKDGFNDGVAVVPSTFEGATAGNIILGGLIGAGIDSSSGASNKYPNQIVVTMVKK